MLSPIPIRLVMADDHEIYREGLKVMLRKVPDIEIVGEAASGTELIDIVRMLEPDVILTDIVMAGMDGIEVTRLLSDQYPKTNIIALSMFEQDNLIIGILEAGAKGYLLKNAHKTEIIEAIYAVHKDIPYYCRNTSSKLTRLIAQSKFNPNKKEERLFFTEREITIIRLICQEFTNKEIGRKLFLSARTVEGYRGKILEKMKVRSTAGIVIYAVKNGIYKMCGQLFL